MSWESTTFVGILSNEAKDVAWKRVCDATSWKRPAGPFVCCYAMEGTCRYGSKCHYAHDVNLLPVLGCQYGMQCIRPKCAAALFNSSWAPESRKSDTLDHGQNEPSNLNGTCNYMQSVGLSCDDKDPIWEELAVALGFVWPQECIGDGDLSEATRQRLSAAGRYTLVDDEMVDEWLCIPGELVADYLESHVMHEWRCSRLRDELRIAQHLCREAQEKVVELPEHKRDAVTHLLRDAQNILCMVSDGRKIADERHQSESNAYSTSIVHQLLDTQATDYMFLSALANALAYACWKCTSAKSRNLLAPLVQLQRSVGHCAYFLHKPADDQKDLRSTSSGEVGTRSLVGLARQAAQGGSHLLAHHVVRTRADPLALDSY